MILAIDLKTTKSTNIIVIVKEYNKCGTKKIVINWKIFSEIEDATMSRLKTIFCVQQLIYNFTHSCGDFSMNKYTNIL